MYTAKNAHFTQIEVSGRGWVDFHIYIYIYMIHGQYIYIIYINYVLHIFERISIMKIRPAKNLFNCGGVCKTN